VHFFKGLSFRKKLTISGSIPLALLGAVVGLLSFLNANSVISESEKRVLADTINRIDININVKVRQLNSFMHNLAGGSFAKTLSDWGKESESGQMALKELRRLSENTFAAYAEITRVSILLENDVLYASSIAEKLNENRLQELYESARQYKGKTNWSDLGPGLLESSKPGSARILVYEGLENSRGQTRGLIILELDPKIFGSLILSKQKILSHQTTFLTDRNGSVIYSDSGIGEEARLQILDHYKKGERRFSYYLNDLPYYVCAQYNGLTAWISFTFIQEDKLFPEAKILKNQTFVLVCVSVLLAAFFLYLLAITVTKPLERLNKGMKIAQDHNFELRLKNDRRDEVGELTESFNNMVERIHVLIHQVYQEKLAQKAAELEALQTQINPHFLYNTLNTINWVLADRGEYDLCTLITSLGKLMQYSMDTTVSLVTLTEECNYIKDYILIQKFRLEDKLEFFLELDPALADFKVPKMILQPLLENAIIHGLGEMKEGGKVWLRVYRESSWLCIEILDNGKGMSPEELDLFRKLLKNDAPNQKKIGIRNVARRMNLHFTNRCEFLVSNKAAYGVSVLLRIQAESTEQEPA